MIAEAGLRADSVHVFPVRVYFEDTDVSGMVYYANYLKSVERGWTEMLRAVALDHQRMMRDDGLAFAVKRCETDYLVPARLDDQLEAHTGNLKIEGASLWAAQVIKRGTDDVVSVRVCLVCLTTEGSGRPARLPGAVRTALGPLYESQNQHRIKER